MLKYVDVDIGKKRIQLPATAILRIKRIFQMRKYPNFKIARFKYYWKLLGIIRSVSEIISELKNWMN